MKAKKKQSNGSKVYLSILKDYEKQKNDILKGYLEKATKLKKQGLKKIEEAMEGQDKESAKNLLDNL